MMTQQATNQTENEQRVQSAAAELGVVLDMIAGLDQAKRRIEEKRKIAMATLSHHSRLEFRKTQLLSQINQREVHAFIEDDGVDTSDLQQELHEVENDLKKSKPALERAEVAIKILDAKFIECREKRIKLAADQMRGEQRLLKARQVKGFADLRVLFDQSLRHSFAELLAIEAHYSFNGGELFFDPPIIRTFLDSFLPGLNYLPDWVSAKQNSSIPGYQEAQEALALELANPLPLLK